MTKLCLRSSVSDVWFYLTEPAENKVSVTLNHTFETLPNLAIAQVKIQQQQ